jgi:hypothetical protein
MENDIQQVCRGRVTPAASLSGAALRLPKATIFIPPTTLFEIKYISAVVRLGLKRTTEMVVD